MREGTLNPTRHKAVVPLLVGGRRKPVCPKHLKGNARTAYRMLMNDLWEGRILDASDRTLLATAAMHYGAAMTAQEAIDKVGAIYPVTRGARDGSLGYKVVEANPAVRILRDSLAEFRQCCDLLGVGPSARARLANMGVKSPNAIRLSPGMAEVVAKREAMQAAIADRKAQAG
jgi:P27 family predicted phage terminase small subunit